MRGRFAHRAATVGLIAATSSLVLIPGTSSAADQPTTVTALRTNNQQNPIGLGDRTPSLQWQVESERRGTLQTAYQVRVASTVEGLADGEADVWDSGRVETSDQVWATYTGPSLASREDYFWSVRVWDDTGAASEWSQPASFETGLLSEDDWAAQWISHDMPQRLPTENSMQDHPARLESGRTLGQTFATDEPFTAAAGRMPTWNTDDSDVTIGLRRGGPSGELVAENRIVDHPDNGWGTVELDDPLPAGTYYLEISDPDGSVGWWSHTEDVYAHGTAYADGERIEGDRTIRWQPANERLDERTALLRRDFSLTGDVASARLYGSALGVYELQLNDERVGEHRLAPGWTDYDVRTQYQTYDVTELLQRGDNAIGASLSPGWYAGKIAIYGPDLYGGQPGLLVQLEVTYTDGRTERIISDASWTSARGPVVASDMQDGEVYDARRTRDGFAEAGYDDADWQQVIIKDDVATELVAQADPPVREIMELEAQEVTEPTEGTYIVDLGQNMVGHARLVVRGAAAGDEITLRFGEVLTPDGELYTENLRTAKATDVYIAAGRPTEVWEPQFTFHGFRYVEVTGYPGDQLPSDAVTGVVVGTDVAKAGSFETSNELINQLQSNIEWSQRGNFLSVPTDTPARDERMGWTGDINVFAPTAAFNADISGFLGDKWLQDLRDAQRADGAVTDVVPFVPIVGAGNAGWGDAAVTVPYTIWQTDGDTQVIEENYAAMTAWVDYLERTSNDLIRPATGYGDWLNLDDQTPVDLVSTAYFAHTTTLLAKMAAAIGEDGEAARLADLADRVGGAFRDEYLAEDGRLPGDSQAGYVLALSFELVPDELEEQVAGHLVRRIEERDWHLSTGFLGTPDLLPVLSRTGHLDVAYRLLNQRSYPSWLYEVDQGATTTWEHWNSIKPDGSFMDPEMNSFNHYAYGAVGDWMYRTIGGLAPDPEAPGYRNAIIRPQSGEGVSSARAAHQSPFGEVVSAWRSRGEKLTMDITVPAGATATVYVPASSPDDVFEGGVPADEAEVVEQIHTDGTAVVYRVGSGQYTFTTDAVLAALDEARFAVGSFAEDVDEATASGGLRRVGPLHDQIRRLTDKLASAEVAFLAGSDAIRDVYGAMSAAGTMKRWLAAQEGAGEIPQDLAAHLLEQLSTVENCLSVVIDELD